MPTGFGSIRNRVDPVARWLPGAKAHLWPGSCHGGLAFPGPDLGAKKGRLISLCQLYPDHGQPHAATARRVISLTR